MDPLALMSNPSGMTVLRLAIDPTSVCLFVEMTDGDAACPVCSRPARRVHSRYTRTLADLPWRGRRAVVQIRVRRFVCDQAACPRRIFAERLPALAAVHARATDDLRAEQRHIAAAVGGEAGSRLAARLNMPASPDTLLRRLRRTPIPAPAPVRVLGVDDWAFRKGHRYGTILCDLERRWPVDLLPERSATALHDWLKNHPEVEVICRDRGDDYIAGATAGAPQAVQVADRWHLLRNLRDALKRVADRHQSDIRAAADEAVVISTASGLEKPLVDDSTGTTPPQAEPPPRATKDGRLEQYERVMELHHQGMSQRAIAQREGLDRGTVARYVGADSFPERATRRYARRTDRFVQHLRARWAEGCHNAAALFAELKTRGYAGSYYTVRRQVARWRTESPAADPGPPAEAASRTPIARPSARSVSWWLLQAAPDLEPEECAFRDRLQERCPAIRVAGDLAREFAGLLRDRNEPAWDGWLERVQAEGVPKELRSFASGLKQDEAAVRAALTMDWSNGQVEGQVNRLKTIKRQMYGRAKFDLLRIRVLTAA